VYEKALSGCTLVKSFKYGCWCINWYVILKLSQVTEAMVTETDPDNLSKFYQNTELGNLKSPLWGLSRNWVGRNRKGAPRL